jgi:uncharacterized membrane protein HdeD (DUF308 family)
MDPNAPATPPAASPRPTATTPMTGALQGGDAAAMSAILAQNWWAVVLRGVCGVIFGLIALFMPGATILGLVLLFSAYLLADGVFGIVAAIRAASRHERWGLLLLEGIVNIAVGALALVWPGLTALAFLLMVAGWARVTGVLEIVAAFKLHVEYGRWWLVLGGLASVVFGVLLVIAPLAGLVVPTWWLGAYALVFGIMLLVLGFRLRAKKEEAPPAATAARA